MQAADVDNVLPMIRDLAVVNNDQTTITAEQLREDGFGDDPWFWGLIAERHGRLIGYALWYLTYNASFGTRVLHLHHLYVEPLHRKVGIGRSLMVAACSRGA
jgi:GNAT superfamily N-acetyltransferase